MWSLTKKQLEQVREYIATYGIRTTDFNVAQTVSVDDWVAIVQGGINKKIRVSDLFDPDVLPSLVVNIAVVDSWDSPDITSGEKALSARLGKELKDLIADSTVEVINAFDSTDVNAALSANKGRELYHMIQDSLTVINNLTTDDPEKALSASMGVELNRLVGLRPTLQNMSSYYKMQWNVSGSSQSINIYTKEQVDALIGGGGGGGGSTTLAGLTDVDVTGATTGSVLKYSSSAFDGNGGWIIGSDSDTWRSVAVKSVSVGTDSINFAEGSNVSLASSSSSGVTTITISATGGGSGGGGGDYYIGNTKAHPSTAEPYALLAGLGSVEILGMSSASGSKKIFFGSSASGSTPYIEWDGTNNCFHFSHGLYSDSFVSAGGLNSGGGGGGSSYLYDLLDVKKVGSVVSRADGTTAAQNNDVLTYNSTAGKWVAAPAQGGSGGSVAWGSITGTLADQTDLANALAAKANTTSLASVATSGSYNDLTNKPSLFSGSYSDLSGKPTFYTLTLGSGGNVYNPVGGNRTFQIGDLTTIIGTSNGSYVQIGQIKLQYDSSNNAIKVVGASGGNANFYATGSVSAGA